MTKTELLQTLQSTHDQFLAAVNLFSGDELETIKVTDDWTPKDILAHVTRWENICAHYLRYVLAQEPIPLLDGTSEEINARNLAEDRALTLDQVWENSDQSFSAVMAMVESLREEDLGKVMRGPWVELQDKTFALDKIIGIDTYEHYPVHVNTIDGWHARNRHTQTHLPPNG